MNLFGYLGLTLICFSYCFLNSKRPNFFLGLNIASCIALFIHAIIIRDIPLVGVNAFAGIMLSIKLKRGGIK